MTSEKRAQELHTDGMSLPRSGRGSAPDWLEALPSDTSSIWNFFTCFSDIILLGKLVVSQNVSYLLILD